MNQPILPSSIVDFWFEGVNDTTVINKNQPPFNKWFSKNPAFDALIKNNFEQVYQKALDGQLRDWEKTREGKLALILLFDQFTRNMYRNTPRMYESDSWALEIVESVIDRDEDFVMPLIHRVFVYMPLMHCEDLEAQKLCVNLFQELVQESKVKTPHNTSYFEYNLRYAKQHFEIIAQFGRFPHRNVILTRPSTPAEQAFLAGKDSGF